MASILKIELEDGIEYSIVDEIENNGIMYYYLVNEDESFNFRIRKVVNDGTDDYINGLDSEKEFEEAMKLYYKKHRIDKN